MSCQAIGGTAVDSDTRAARKRPDRRHVLLGALLAASAFVPTLIAVVAGTASLDQAHHSRPPLLAGPPDRSVVIGGVPGDPGGTPNPSPSAGSQPAGQGGGSRPTGHAVVRGDSGGARPPATQAPPPKPPGGSPSVPGGNPHGSASGSQSPSVSPSGSPSQSPSSSPPSPTAGPNAGTGGGTIPKPTTPKVIGPNPVSPGTG